MKIHLGSMLVCLLVSSARGVPGVSFWQKDFTMTCPGVGNWFKAEVTLQKDTQILTQEYIDTSQGHYHCEYGIPKITYHFYVRGKVCDNCYELDSWLVAVGIIADIVLTLGVILVVYVWTRRRQAAKATPKKVSSSGGPSAPSPDYEVLNTHSRSDPYSTVHRTG